MEKEEYIRYKDINLHLTVLEADKSAPCVIFIPGAGCYAELYSDFLWTLHLEGLNVLGLTLQGHGKSAGKRGQFSYGDVISNVKAAAKYALENYNDKIGICGSSLGGILSLYMSIEIEEIKCAVCHNVIDLKDLPFGSPSFDGLNMEYIPLQFLFDWNKIFDEQANLDKLRSDELMVWEYTVDTVISLFAEKENKPNIEEATKATMVLVSGGDKILPPDVCKKVYDKMSCKKKYLSIPSVGHMLFIEHIDEVIDEVGYWFKENLC